MARARRQAPRRRKCPKCDGSGVVATSQGLFALQQPCPRCRGMGTIVETPCPTCHGSGRERRTKRYTVRIPAGVKDGTKIKLKGKGEAGYGGAPAGDLFVVTRVEPSKLYERRGDDLVLDVPVDVRRGRARRDDRDPDAGRPRVAQGSGGLAGREAAAGEGPRRAAAEGRRPRRPARAPARPGAGEADEGAKAGARGLPEGVEANPRDRLSADGRPAPLHDLGRRRARRHAPADAADLRAEGPRAPEAHGRQHAPLLGRRHRAAAADPAADDRDRAQPGGRRARAALEDELQRMRRARPDGAGDARGDRAGAPPVPPRPRPLPARRRPAHARSGGSRWISTS